MAGDWIKMRTCLVRSPKTLRVAAVLGVPKATVLGAMFILWSMADEQTTNGVLPGLTFQAIDAEVGLPGFCAALADPCVDWARQHDTGVILPRWTTHNGASAKSRARNARRNANLRTRQRDGVSVTQASRERHLEKREEKRREEKPLSVFSVGGKHNGAAAAAAATDADEGREGKPIAEAVASLPPIAPSDVRQGEVSREVGTPLGDVLIARLKAAGVRASDVWTFARRADFDADLVAYVAARMADVKPAAKDGQTESELRVANRRAGLAKLLANQPRGGMDGFEKFTAERHARRTKGIAAVWAWVNAQNPPPEQAAEFEAGRERVRGWLRASGLGNADPLAWSKALPTIDDVVFHRAVLNDAARGAAWAQIVNAAATMARPAIPTTQNHSREPPNPPTQGRGL